MLAVQDVRDEIQGQIIKCVSQASLDGDALDCLRDCLLQKAYCQ